MNTKIKVPLEMLSDNVTEAHSQIQNDFSDINPVIGLSQKLRTVGILADMMTIDCLKSGKRIIVILHDATPNIVNYQFSYIKQDPADQFEEIPLQDLSKAQFYTWMKDYFS